MALNSIHLLAPGCRALAGTVGLLPLLGALAELPGEREELPFRFHAQGFQQPEEFDEVDPALPDLDPPDPGVVGPGPARELPDRQAGFFPERPETLAQDLVGGREPGLFHDPPASSWKGLSSK